MPYIAEIVDLLNADLASGKLIDGTRFINDLNGLSELQVVNDAPPNSDITQRTIPVLVNTKDYSEFSGFDDRYSFQAYHRLISLEQIESPITYGRSMNNGREVATMRMVVFADNKRARLEQYQLAFMVRSSLNKQYTGSTITAYSGLLGATVEAKTDNYDGVDIWQSEYGLPAENYPVRMHQCLFTIDYTITSDYNNSCITSCLEC